MRILILGAGFGGLEAATLLREQLDTDDEIVLVDRKNYFTVGFSKLDVLFGRKSFGEVTHGFDHLPERGITFLKDEVQNIDADAGRVELAGTTVSYDYLILALGAELAPEATPGFPEAGYHFYSFEGAQRLHEVVREFQSGTVTLAILGVPYQCPPAPFEAALLLEEHFRNAGVRESVELQIAVPGKSALPVSPEASERIESRLAERGIALFREHAVSRVEPQTKEAVTSSGARLASDLFIGVPVHRAPRAVRESQLGNGGWIQVNPGNLRTAYDKVYAVGDCAAVPVGKAAVPKAGAFAEDAARSAVADIISREKGYENSTPYEGRGECYIEVGDGRVAAMNANFLGADRPQVSLMEPSTELAKAKQRFVESRVERWLR